jgi:hypothetical protein
LLCKLGFCVNLIRIALASARAMTCVLQTPGADDRVAENYHGAIV